MQPRHVIHPGVHFGAEFGPLPQDPFERFPSIDEEGSLEFFSKLQETHFLRRSVVGAVVLESDE